MTRPFFELNIDIECYTDDYVPGNRVLRILIAVLGHQPSTINERVGELPIPNLNLPAH